MTLIDSLGMWDAAAAFPEQVARAASDARDVPGIPEHEAIEHVVVLGMGGSGIVGDVVMATAGPFMSVPLVVCKMLELPPLLKAVSLITAPFVKYVMSTVVGVDTSPQMILAMMMIGGPLVLAGLRMPKPEAPARALSLT